MRVLFTYRKYCTENNVEAASISKLRSYFKIEKYSIYSPKKDQCDICTSYNTANITEEEHKHILLKTEAGLENNRDNEIALNDESTVVVYIDLQKVLLSPSIQASAVYYKTKLCCHNYTTYDKKTKQATSYIIV